MRAVLAIPLLLVLTIALYIWIMILIIPLAIAKLITSEDYSRGWMVNWYEYLVKKFKLDFFHPRF